ncbi:hypothetical protein QT974_26350 [Microcoleus sp. herbarium12]
MIELKTCFLRAIAANLGQSVVDRLSYLKIPHKPTNPSYHWSLLLQDLPKKMNFLPVRQNQCEIY